MSATASDWTQHFNEDYKLPFWHNELTGESVWERPKDYKDPAPFVAAEEKHLPAADAASPSTTASQTVAAVALAPSPDPIPSTPQGTAFFDAPHKIPY